MTLKKNSDTILLCSFADGPDNWKRFGVPLGSAAGGITFLVVLIVICRKLRQQNNEETERRRLLREGGVDQHINHFNNLNEGRAAANCSQPMSVSSTSSHDNRISSKDSFNIGSVPV